MEPTPRIKDTQRITDVITSIRNDEFRLPSIQRSFVWEPYRICKLMDSLMNDYPIGSFLVWNPTNLKIRTRKFLEDYKQGTRPISEDDSTSGPYYLVLDGQQRFQSLYVGFNGKYDGKQLFFLADSNPRDVEDDVKYKFQFMIPSEATKDPHWLRPSEITGLKIEDITGYVERKFFGDRPEEKTTIARNLSRFIRVFNIDEKISFQEVNEEMEYDDVLEVFVRVNSGGIVLTKSDLVFSTVILRSPEMESKFVEAVDLLNGLGKFDFDIDFLIKASLVVFGKGAKYDVAKLKDDAFLKRLTEGFDEFELALTSTVEFLKSDAKILSKRFLQSDLALIPIVDFIMRQPSQQIPSGQTLILRQYLYMAFFTRFYSYGADSKIDYIHRLIEGATNSHAFPIEDIRVYIEERTGVPYVLTRSMLSNVDLILNIVQGGISEIPEMRGWSLERDHIIPKSLLINAGLSEDEIDTVGNLRLLNKTRNILKSDKLDVDAEFFGNNNTELRTSYKELCKRFSKKTYNKFVEEREKRIAGKVHNFLFG